MSDWKSDIRPAEHNQTVPMPKSPLKRLIVGLALMSVVVGALAVQQLLHVGTELAKQTESVLEAREEMYRVVGMAGFVMLMSGMLVWLVYRKWLKIEAAEKVLRRNYERLVLVQEVSQYNAASVQDLLDFALARVIALSESSIGYIYNYHEEERQFVLNTWSKDVMASCRVAEPQTVYHLDKTGIWGEVVRQRSPIMVNDYTAPNDLKKGYPEGHVHLARFLSIPVFDNDRIVAVVGVANKLLPYDQSDIQSLELMMEEVWKISERFKLQEQIASVNEIFGLFMKFSPIYCYIKEVSDQESTVVQASDNFIDMVGIPAADMIGKNMRQLFPQEFADSITADDIHVVNDQKVLRLEEQLKGKNFITYKFPIHTSDGQNILAGYTIDVTDLKQTELKLKTALIQSDRFRTALDNVSAYIYIKDLQSRYIYANNLTLELFGCSSDELVGCDDSRFFPLETARHLREIDARVFRGEKTHEEIDVNGEGLERRIYWEIKSPIYTDVGNSEICGLLGISTDITHIKLTEELLRVTQQQLMHNDKLASIGQLAAGMAHEINNPIGFVGSNLLTLGKYVEKYNCYIEKLEQELSCTTGGILPDQLREMRRTLKLDYVMRDISVLIDESNEGIERVKRIVNDLKTFSRADSSARGLADLNSCFESAITIAFNEIKYIAELRRDYGELPTVKCNIQQINQVFLNLLINAGHAIQAKGSENGEIAVSSWCDEHYAFIAVTDSGCGIPNENLVKIFDAFYTTKEIGKGTGLGLSISAEIIRKHGGEIRAVSEIGTGSTFTVRLPLHTEEDAESEENKS